MHPILFQVGSVTVYSYGVAVAVAVGVVVVLAALWAPKAGLSRTMVLDALFVLFISGVAGARLWYVIQHWDRFAGKGWAILWLQEGGLVWYGGFFLALLCGYLFARIKKLSFLAWADFIAPLLALAHGIGRVGCYLNGCCYGRLWGIPTQIAEALSLMALSAILFALWKKRRFDGQVVSAYAILYPMARFVIEFSRQDQLRHYGLSIAQWTSVTLFVMGLVFYAVVSRKK